MNNNWQYTNIKLPMTVLWMDTDEDVHEVIKALMGHDCVVYDTPSSGYSGCGPWEEGDIDLIDNGLGYTLSYDFMELSGATGRIFRYTIDRQPGFDNE